MRLCGFDCIERDLHGYTIVTCQCGWGSDAHRQERYAMREWSNHFALMTDTEFQSVHDVNTDAV